ncbi:hypothetical protein BGZ65_002223 [Modicella reniformis]|uniref:Major facilitator superfamily (MFS) profile domain-containing protein n=1 Tax=Modicella reniformis TaxID=1440133 RepID=A0A9P6J129_9FUNG|nr:hypothetical protein BGZ65_002223 [Modicella reniformis]
MTSSSQPSGHPEATTYMTPASELPSTLAMAFENPSSTSLALTSGIAHMGHHHHDLEHNSSHMHPNRPRSKAPSVISEKFEGQDRSSTDNDENATVNEKGDRPPSTFSSSKQGKILDYPEGGFGWLVVLASFVVNFWAFGPNITAVVALGIVIASLGFIVASFSTQLWQLYLTQGLMYGFGGGIVFFSSISVTAQYFEKLRGLANGIAVAGSGIGGLVLAPLTRLLIAQVGIQWCQRIVGFCILGFMAAIFPFIRPRVKPVKGGPIFDWSLFKIPGFLWLLLTAFVVTFGYMVPIFLVPTYCREKLKEPATTGANLISLYSGINAVSRIGLGVAADKLGRTNTLFTCCFLAGVSCIAIWSVASNIQILTSFMVFYGLFGGGIFPVVVAQVVGVERLSAALGILYFGNVVGNLLGAPIATAIMQAQGGEYLGAIMFAGFTPVLAATFVLFVRFRINKKVLAIA